MSQLCLFASHLTNFPIAPLSKVCSHDSLPTCWEKLVSHECQNMSMEITAEEATEIEKLDCTLQRCMDGCT
jgi:hypothetical protein